MPGDTVQKTGADEPITTCWKVDGAQVCKQEEQQDKSFVDKWLPGIVTGAITLVDLVGFGFVFASRRYSEKARSAYIPAGNFGPMADSDAFFAEAAKARGIPEADRQKLRSEFNLSLMSNELTGNLNDPVYRNGFYMNAFERAVFQLYPQPLAPNAARPAFDLSGRGGVKTMVPGARQLYSMDSILGYLGSLDGKWQARFHELANQGNHFNPNMNAPGLGQAMSDAMTVVIAERAERGLPNFIPEGRDAKFGNQRGDTMLYNGFSLRPWLTTESEASAFMRAITNSQDLSAAEDARIGDKWMLFDTKTIAQALNQSASFKTVDGSKKVAIVREIVAAVSVPPADADIGATLPFTPVSRDVISKALVANGLDPKDFKDVPQIMLRRDKAVLAEAGQLGYQHQALAGFLGQSAFEDVFRAIPAEWRPHAQRALADYIISRWNSMSGAQQESIGMSLRIIDGAVMVARQRAQAKGITLKGEPLYDTYNKGKPIPILWVEAQVAAFRRGDVSDASIDRVINSTELRMEATLAMREHLNSERYSNYSEQQKNEIAKGFGEAVAGDESYRAKKYPTDANFRVREGRLASAAEGIADGLHYPEPAGSTRSINEIRFGRPTERSADPVVEEKERKDAESAKGDAAKAKADAAKSRAEILRTVEGVGKARRGGGMPRGKGPAEAIK
ncbi:MAG: hypothetical protein WC956_10185 [bacterium]